MTMHLPPPVFASAFTDIRPGLLLWTWITFILVAYLLKRFAWGPLSAAVKQRETAIQADIGAAQREREGVAKLLAEQQAVVQKSRDDAAEQVRQTRADMDRFRDELIAKARSESEAMKVDARKVIEGERSRAVADIRAEAVSLSVQIAEKLLAANLDPAKQQKLADQFVSELQASSTGPRTS